jgi:hypothetical protein
MEAPPVLALQDLINGHGHVLAELVVQPLRVTQIKKILFVIPNVVLLMEVLFL